MHPALVGLPLPAIIAATGVAKSTALGWRSGRRIPHPMHWATLTELAGISAQDLIRQVRTSSCQPPESPWSVDALRKMRPREGRRPVDSVNRLCPRP